MNCLDTYALWEILLENPRYTSLFKQPFVITAWTLAEFYKTMLRTLDRATATHWFHRLTPHTFNVEIEILRRAIDFMHEHRKERLSIFDCVGYQYALNSGFPFVTGDQEFENKPGVLFIKK